jgi:hypothetical protein
MNESKNASMGERQKDLAKKLRKAGLVQNKHPQTVPKTRPSKYAHFFCSQFPRIGS